MTLVTIHTTIGAGGFHRFFSLPNGRYYEFSSQHGYQEGWLQNRGSDDILSSETKKSKLSIAEIVQVARTATIRGYNYFINNCRTFVFESISGQRSIDLLAVSSIIIAGIILYKTLS